MYDVRCSTSDARITWIYCSIFLVVSAQSSHARSSQMNKLKRQAGASRLCLALLPLLLVAPVIAQQLEAELLVSQLDDDDPQRHEPYVACDASSGECLALTLLVHQHPWRCRDVELTAHVQGVPHTATLTQVCIVVCIEGLAGCVAPVNTCHIRSTATVAAVAKRRRARARVPSMASAARRTAWTFV